MTENSNPLVSVIMPVYNCAQYVDEAIESIVKQTYRNMEIFIIDDCSTDGTKDKVESWAKLDERIKPIYKAVNTGYVDSLNMAICLSNGEYIARMDGDDISLPERIEKQVIFMDKNLKIGLLGTGHSIIGESTVIKPVIDSKRLKIGLLLAAQFTHPTVIFRRSSIIDLGRFYNSQYVPAEDYEYWNFLIPHLNFANLDEVLFQYRVHTGNISRIKENYLNTEKILTATLQHVKAGVTDDFILFLSLLHGNPNRYKIVTFFEKINLKTVLDEICSLKKSNYKTQTFDIQYFNRLLNVFYVVIIKSVGLNKVLISTNSIKTRFLLIWLYLIYRFNRTTKFKNYFKDFLAVKTGNSENI